MCFRLSVFVPNGARHFFGVQVRLEFLPVLLQQMVNPHHLNCLSVGLTMSSRCILLVLHATSLRNSTLISSSHGAGLELCLVMGACIPMAFVILNITRPARGKSALSILLMFGFCPSNASHFMSFKCFVLMLLCGRHGCSLTMNLCLQRLVLVVGASCANCDRSVRNRSPARLVCIVVVSVMISHLVVFVAVVMGMLPWILLCLPLFRLMANMFRMHPLGAMVVCMMLSWVMIPSLLLQDPGADDAPHGGDGHSDILPTDEQI